MMMLVLSIAHHVTMDLPSWMVNVLKFAVKAITWNQVKSQTILSHKIK